MSLNKDVLENFEKIIDNIALDFKVTYLEKIQEKDIDPTEELDLDHIYDTSKYMYESGYELDIYEEIWEMIYFKVKDLLLVQKV